MTRWQHLFCEDHVKKRRPALVRRRSDFPKLGNKIGLH